MYIEHHAKIFLEYLQTIHLQRKTYKKINK